MSRSVKTIVTIPDCADKREDKKDKAFIDKVKTIQISGKATPTRGRK